MASKLSQLLTHIKWLVSDPGTNNLREGVPCADNIHHTSYSLIRSPGSKEVWTFPESNFLLTSPEWQLAEREILSVQGFALRLEVPLKQRLETLESCAAT